MSYAWDEGAQAFRRAPARHPIPTIAELYTRSDYGGKWRMSGPKGAVCARCGAGLEAVRCLVVLVRIAAYRERPRRYGTGGVRMPAQRKRYCYCERCAAEPAW